MPQQRMDDGFGQSAAQLQEPVAPSPRDLTYDEKKAAEGRSVASRLIPLGLLPPQPSTKGSCPPCAACRWPH